MKSLYKEEKTTNTPAGKMTYTVEVVETECGGGTIAYFNGQKLGEGLDLGSALTLVVEHLLERLVNRVGGGFL